MRKHISIIRTLTALMTVGLMFISCSKEKEQVLVDKTFTMTVNASKGDHATKDLSLDGTTLTATWKTGEKVYVHNNTKNADLDGYLEAQSDGTSTVLKGSLTGTIENGDELVLRFCSDSYDLQQGTIEWIAANCDYATATVTVTDASAASVTTTDAAFANQQAIVKFTLMNTGGSEISASTFTVQVDGNTYAVVLASPASVVYVAVPGFSGQKVSLFARVGTDWYCKEQPGITFSNGQYYTVAVKMAQTGILPGKFTVNGSGGQVRFSQGNLQATYNGSAWSWAFAANQWDYIGGRSSKGSEPRTGNNYINGNGTMSTSGTVDLFGWVGDSSSFTGVAQYGITNDVSPSNYSGNSDQTLKSDWGTLSVTNGGSTENYGWYTLTSAEWNYLFTRSSGSTVNGTSDARYTHAIINTDINSGVNGIILFPDGVTIGSGETTSWGNINSHSRTWEAATKCTSAQWTALAAKGCVFLPAAGSRHRSNANTVGSNGFYWSSTFVDGRKSYSIFFCSNDFSKQYARDLYYGQSVRLVKNAD